MASVSGPSIVVGVDGSAGSRRALRWAAEEARQRDATLRVVLAWESAYLATYSSYSSYSSMSAHGDRGEQEQAAQALLAETLRAVFGADAPDRVVAKVVQGLAERVLVEESCAADLLVLGSTPASEQGSPSAGRIISGCLHQARCPVTIIGTCKTRPSA